MARQVAKKSAPPKKKKLIRLDTDERRAQLLALGKKAFTSMAFDEVSIDELARKAKISKGLFYYYFPTKRDLYIAGLSETAKDLVGKLTSVPRDLPPRERAGAAVDAYLDHVIAEGQAYVALVRGGIGSDPEIAGVIEGIRRGVVDEFMHGAPIAAFLRTRPTAKLGVRGWVGMVEAVSIEWLGNPEGADRASVRELLVDALFDLLTRILAPEHRDRIKPGAGPIVKAPPP